MAGTSGMTDTGRRLVIHYEQSRLDTCWRCGGAGQTRLYVTEVPPSPPARPTSVTVQEQLRACPICGGGGMLLVTPARWEDPV